MMGGQSACQGFFISDLEVGWSKKVKFQGNLRHHRNTLSLGTVPNGQGWISFPVVINFLVNPCFGPQLSLPVTRFASSVGYMEHLFLMMVSVDLRINPSWGSHDPSRSPLTTKLILYTAALCYKLHDPTAFPGRF